MHAPRQSTTDHEESRIQPFAQCSTDRNATTGGSRLNQVERWFALLTQRAIKRAAHTSTSQLERAIREYIDAHNQEPKPFHLD